MLGAGGSQTKFGRWEGGGEGWIKQEGGIFGGGIEGIKKWGGWKG